MLLKTDRTLRLLHIDSSARPGLSGQDKHGSHTRHLSDRFVRRWMLARPDDAVIRRDVAAEPLEAIDAAWLEASFMSPASRSPTHEARLRQSDLLVEELLAADILVIGVPMYNFGVPSQLKVWIDNVVRVGMTFGFDRSRMGDPYWPMVPEGKQLILLTSRGDYGYGSGGRIAEMNLTDAGLRVPLGYIGVTEHHSIAIEYDEFRDERLATSILAAEAAVDSLVDSLLP